jgi:hypothetical protein
VQKHCGADRCSHCSGRAACASKKESQTRGHCNAKTPTMRLPAIDLDHDVILDQARELVARVWQLAGQPGKEADTPKRPRRFESLKAYQETVRRLKFNSQESVSAMTSAVSRQLRPGVRPFTALCTSTKDGACTSVARSLRRRNAPSKPDPDPLTPAP